MGVKEKESEKAAINRIFAQLTFASSFEFSVLSTFRSPSSFSILVLTACSSSLAIFSCSSVRWTFNSGVTRTRRRHQGQSRTCINARTFRWMQRTANSWKQSKSSLEFISWLEWQIHFYLHTTLTDSSSRQISARKRLQLYDAIW